MTKILRVQGNNNLKYDAYEDWFVGLAINLDAANRLIRKSGFDAYWRIDDRWTPKTKGFIPFNSYWKWDWINKEYNYTVTFWIRWEEVYE
jgi:hypothetical protein